MRRPDPDARASAVERPGRVRRLWSVLPVGVAFALFGVVVWLAYQDAGIGPPVGEPPLIKAAPDPLKVRPDETEESSLAAEQGAVGRLWSDAEQADQPERLLPSPEAPLSPPAIEAPATVEATVEQPAGEPAAADRAPEAAGEEEPDVEVAALPSEPADLSESVSAQSATDQSLQEAEAALDRLLAEVTAMSEDTDVAAAVSVDWSGASATDGGAAVVAPAGRTWGRGVGVGASGAGDAAGAPAAARGGADAVAG